MKQRLAGLLLSAALVLGGCGVSVGEAVTTDESTTQDLEEVWETGDPQSEQTDAASQTGAACWQQSDLSAAVEEEAPELEQLRGSIEGSYYACAVAYLGQVEEASAEGVRAYLEDNGQTERFPFLQDLPEEQLVLCAGTELYCVISQSVCDTVTVRALDFSVNGVAKAGQTLYSGGGQPLLLLCNQAGSANVRLTVSGQAGTLEYSPSQTGGALEVPATGTGVYDFSPDRPALSLDQELAQTWRLETEGVSCTLSVGQDGALTLEGDQGSYEGALSLRLEDSGGYIAALDLADRGGETAVWLHCVYRIQAEKGLLLLTYIQGDGLYPDAPSALSLVSVSN